MFAALARVLGVRNLAAHMPRVNRINHWEDGLAMKMPPDSRGCLLDVEVGLGWCGDFCVAPGVQGAALSGRAMAETLAAYLQGPSEFDARGLLPADDEWVAIDRNGLKTSLVDIGAFSGRLGLRSASTHTDLVPSAVEGYNNAAHYGAAGKGKGGGSPHSGGKGKGVSKSQGKGQGKGQGKSQGKGKWRGQGYY